MIEGKRVVAPASDLVEAKNAIKVYARFDEWNPLREGDLFAAHEMLMDGLVDDAGRYRLGGVGVVSGETVIHMAPPAGQIPGLMKNFFQWIDETDHHPLVDGSIFHYEFEFIHSFSDGNGRIGRLWQSLLLAQWNEIFATLPVESLIFENQDRYYLAIHNSTSGADSRPFVEFLLTMILEALSQTPPDTPQVRLLLQASDRDYSRVELQEKLGLRDARSFRTLYLNPAIRAGWIELTIPDKPNSRNQRYRLTAAGKALRILIG